MDNVIISYNGIEIYRTDVDILIDRFLSEYAIEKDMLYKSVTFISLLTYIKHNLLEQIIYKDNAKRNTYDYELLDEIHKRIFMPLTGKYNHVPSLQLFSVLVGLNNDYMTEVMSGTYNSGSKVNEANTRTVRKWYNISKTASVTRAEEENSIGSIFISKAVYGLRDNDQLQVIHTTDTPMTTGQILEKYGKTEKPKLTDNFED